MSNTKNIFGDMTVADIIHHIYNLVDQTDYITSAFKSLVQMGDGDSGDCGAPGNIMGKAKAEAIADVVKNREATNQQILRLYEKMYDDMIRIGGLALPAEDAADAQNE